MENLLHSSEAISKRSSKAQIQKLLYSLDLLSNILPFLGDAKNCCYLLLHLWKKTNDYFKEYKEVLLKKVLKSWKYVSKIRLNEETIDSITKSKIYLLFNLDINISTPEDYSCFYRLLTTVFETEPIIKESVKMIYVNNIETNIAEFTKIFEKSVELGMSPYVFRTYTTDLVKGIPYLSTCFVTLETPWDSPFIVEALDIDSNSNFVMAKTAWHYLNSLKATCKDLRIQDRYLTEMYERRMNFSASIKASVTNLCLHIRKDQDLQTVVNTVKWTVESQLTGITEYLFSFDHQIEFGILEAILNQVHTVEDIVLKEEHMFFGDYVQSHHTDVWVFLVATKEWVRFNVDTFKWSYNALVDIHSIDNEFLLLQNWKEIEFQGINQFQRLAECKLDVFSQEELQKPLIVIPRNRVLINHIMNINMKYLPSFDFETLNIIVINHNDFGQFEELVFHKPKSMNMDIDLELYKNEVSRKDIDMMFEFKVRYLTLTHSQLTNENFDHLLSKISEDISLNFLEFHDLPLNRLILLVEILKIKPNYYKLQFFFTENIRLAQTDQETPETPTIHEILMEYKKSRPFVQLEVHESH